MENDRVGWVSGVLAETSLILCDLTKPAFDVCKCI